MSGIVPFQYELKPGHVYDEYKPNPLEQRFQKILRDNLEEEWNYRRPYEKQWQMAARRFNLLTEKIDDPSLSNVLFPLVKTVIMQWLNGVMDIPLLNDYRPGPDDEDKVELWKDMRDHVNNQTNMSHVMHEIWLNVAIFGTGIIEDGFQNAFMTIRDPEETGNFEATKVVRDPKNTKVFSKSVPPMHHSISPGGLTQLEAPHQSTVQFYSPDDWAVEFGRVPNSLGQPLYRNVGAVQPGKVQVFDKASDRYEAVPSANPGKIAVIKHYIPSLGVHIIESNGVINWLGRNPYKHGHPPYSLITRPGQLDVPRMQTHSLYGEGFGHALRGLDALMQGAGNMTVDALYHENSTVISVPHGLNLDIDDIDFYMGTIIHGAGDVVVSPLGKMSGKNFDFMNLLNDLVIALTQVNIRSLIGEQNQTTVFELTQKIRDAAKGTKAILKYNANHGLKNHEEMQLSNMFQFMPVEQYDDISDVSGVMELVKEGRISKRDVLYENGIPVKIRNFPRVTTKGRVIKQVFKEDGTLDKEKTKTIRKGANGSIQIRPEAILPEQWYRTNGVPEIYVEPADEISAVKELDAARSLKFSEYARVRNQEGANFDLDQIDEDVVRGLGRDPGRYINRKKKPTQIGSQDTKEMQKKMEEEMDKKNRGEAVSEGIIAAPPSAEAPLPENANQVSQNASSQFIPGF